MPKDPDDCIDSTLVINDSHTPNVIANRVKVKWCFHYIND